MLERAQGLTSVALEGIADLERRVIAHDGGRLKLEWSTLRRRSTEEVRDLLFWQEGRMIGFLGIYGFNASTLELTGMVDPTARRHGVGRSLFEAALPICRAAGRSRTLMVVPRVSAAGREFALSRGMTHNHSEHALTLAKQLDPPGANDLVLRGATAEDLPVLSRLIVDAFGGGPVDAGKLKSDRGGVLLIERGGEVVGTIATSWSDQRASVYGFVVAPAWRGRGIGGGALRRVCHDLFATGAENVSLEVEVTNERALDLYTSLGFAPIATDDYYELQLADPAPSA